jgi:RHS repeat-associated protein
VRLPRFIFVLLLVVLAISIAKTAAAQDDPDFDVGMKPFGAYHGGNIDTINLFNGMLNLDIPLISYPQRGGKLKLDFHLRYADAGATGTVVGTCYPPPIGCTYYWQPEAVPGWCGGMGSPANDVPLCHGFQITDEGAENWEQSLLSCSQLCTLSALVRDPSGATHQLLPTAGGSTTTWESVDGTPFQVVTPTGNGTYSSVTGPDGTMYDGASYLSKDTNGNAITYSNTIGWTDTLGRVIPPIPAASSNISNCPQPPSVPVAPISSATWNLPGVSGGTYPITFCYIQLSETNPSGSISGPYTYTGTELQSVVLPNGTSWTFEYTNDEYADLAEVIFPTGGSISYSGYTPWEAAAKVYPYDFHRAPTSRTLNPNDGITPSSTWNYAYSSSTGSGEPTITTVVSAPPSSGSTQDDTVHTFAPFSTTVPTAGSETTAQYYQGSHTSGALLKTVNTQYYWVAYGTPSVESTISVVPEMDTTLWANGQQAQTKYQYDTNLSYYFPDFTSNEVLDSGLTLQKGATYGRLLYRYDYDYSGSLLRTTTNTYLAFTNSSYLSANLLDLPSSVQVTGSGPGSLTDYYYDQNNGSPQGVLGNLTSTSRWLNTTNTYLTTSNVYNSNGLVTSSTDPKGNITKFGYAPSSCPANSGYAGSGPASVTNALNQTTSSCYDLTVGLLVSTTDPNSLTTSYAYDNMLRTLQIDNPEGGQALFCYTDTGTETNGGTCSKSSPPYEVVISEKINSSANRLSYLMVDGVGRQIRQAVTNGETKPYDEADTCYDGDGRFSFKSYPFQDTGPFATSRSCASPELGDSLAYDGLSRTTKVTHADGSYTSTSYSGSSITVTDEQDKTRETTADGLGRLTQVIENPGGLGYTTAYTYDALDDLTGVTQASSRQRTFVYDSLSRLTSSTNPEANWSPTNQTYVATTYSYDADGNLINKTEPAQNQQASAQVTLTYCYDALNRMTAKGYTSQTCASGLLPSPVATYVYDGGALPSGCSVGSFSYGLIIGKRSAMCDAAGSEAWSYNIVSGSGWQITDQRTTNSLTPKTAIYQKNFLGSPASIQYPSGRTISYNYNAGARPISAVDGTTSVYYANTAHYWAGGSPCWTVYGAAITGAATYNGRLQLLEMQSTGSVVTYSGSCAGLGQTGNLLDLSYNFNYGSGDNGNVMGVTNNRDTTRSQSFTYDALNRLLTSTASTYATSPSHCWGEAYKFDNQASGGAWGNLTSIGVASSAYNGCTQESLSVTATAQNQITNGTSIGYDTAGNMTTNSGSTYSYDAENHLTSTAGVTYTYDGDGKRVEKSNGKIYWYGMDGSVLDETDLSGSITNSSFNEYVYLGRSRIARHDSSNNVYYYTGDHLSTSRVIAEVPSGSTTATLCYDADFYPFGGERAYTNTCSQNYKFTGKERDSESGLDMFDARYYASSLGRFMTPDWAAKPEPIPYADFGNPQSLNQYSYSENNPSSKSDPDGHCDVDGEHHWGWCIWHTLGLYETQVDRVNDARNFFNNNDVTIGGNHVDPSKMTDQQVLAAFKQYNADYLAAGGGINPNLALSGLLPGAGLKYEANPKHGSSARGDISAEPTNPQQALENSVPIKNTSTARVGVDPSTGEYVMFRETSSGVYHGYATTNFNDLPNEAKAALQNAGMVSQRGKIQ